MFPQSTCFLRWGFFVYSIIFTNGIAFSWEHPVWPYTPGSYDGRSFFYDQDHLGEDIKLDEGVPVRAIGDGIIKVYRSAEGYGELVVVIEHDLGRTYAFEDAYGNIVESRHILSICGHLRKSSERNGNGLNWREGQTISSGSVGTLNTIIGYVNNSSHPDGGNPDPNGDGLEHLHMGIRLSDAQTAIQNDPRAWFRGYEQSTNFGSDFAAASKVMRILQHVGRFSDSRYPGSWKEDGTSQAFLNAYNRYDGPVKLGFPFDNGSSVYVHQWPDDDPIHKVIIQDFLNNDTRTRYGSDGQTALIYNRGMNRCFLLKEGMWGLYKPPQSTLAQKYQSYLHGLFGPHDLGAPKTDEYRRSDEIIQQFDRGELRFSEQQDEWTVTWHDTAPADWKAGEAYRVIPQWEQISSLGRFALVSNTLIQLFQARSPNSTQTSSNRSLRLLVNQPIELVWQIESPPPASTIDIYYSVSGERPFTDQIITSLQATISGSYQWTPPETIQNSVWVEMIVRDAEGMIVESQTSVIPLAELPTPTPTYTSTPTYTPVPPTPTNTPTPKSPAPLSGTVTDISTGRPIANAIITVVGGRSVATNPQGEFEFVSLSPGVYDVTVSKTGYQTVTIGMVIVIPGQPAALNVQLTTPGLLNIETTSLPAVETGLPYNPRVRVTGGTPKYTYLVASGSLPPGLYLDASTGNITGVPTISGSFTFAIGVRDLVGAYTEREYTIIVADPLVIQTESRLPRGSRGTAYFQSLQISGGVLPYTFIGPEAPVSFPESPHPYSNYTYRTWSYSVPGVPNEIRVTFDARTQVESGYDRIYVKDGNGNNIPGSPFTGSELSGKTVTMPGSKVIITLRSDGSVTGWGFKITSISPLHPSGNLAPGLLLDTSGNISGVPSQTGAYSFTIQVADAEGRIVEKQFNLEIIDPLAIETNRIHDGIVGQVYNQKLEASGGAGQLLWEVYAGVLPRGLSLHPQSGMLSGTPLEETYGSIVIAVSDEEGRIVYQDFTLKVSKPLRILSTTLPNALKDEPYSELIRFEGGQEAYTFTLEGNLPDGLSLDPATGIISGIPTAAQFSNFSISIADSSYPTRQSVSQPFSMRVTSDLTITSSAVLPNAKENVEINAVILVAKGGPSPYRWNLQSGYMPDGVSLNENTGEISGTPSFRGDYIFSIQVTDASGRIAGKEFFLHVSDDLSIETTVLPDGAKDVEYRNALEAKGGIPPYTWRLRSGTLPDGLSFNANGTIEGTPASRQTYSFTVEVNDSDSPAQTMQYTYIIDVQDTLFISTRRIPNARVDEAYTTTFHAQLGVPPYQWRLESGILPPGVELITSPTVARIEGIPAEPGTYTFVLVVSDFGTPVQTSTYEYTMQVYGEIDIERVELKSALVGVPYSENFIASGGQLPYVWRIVEGKLPNGLNLNQSTGHIFGLTTLGVGQSSEFTVRVTDSGEPFGFDEKTYVIRVIEGIEITTFTLTRGIEFVPYSVTLEGQGGISPYHWSILSGRLPNGVTLNANTGKIAGTPEETGRFEFTIQMMDASDTPFVDSRTYAWEIIENPAPPTPTPMPPPLFTPTPSPTPLISLIDLHDFVSYPVTGYELTSSIEYGAVPTDNAFAGATDGEGMIVTLQSGQGVFLQYNGIIDLNDPAIELSVSVRSDNPAVELALVSIANPVDGSLGYVNPIKSEVPVDRWGQMRLIYDSPTEQIIPVLQFVLSSAAPAGTQARIYVDNFGIQPYRESANATMRFMADSTFDSIGPDLNGLNVNAFLPEGAVPGFVSLTSGLSGQGIRLELLPNQLATHFAMLIDPGAEPSDLYGNVLMSSVMMKRERSEDGMTALVITDGEQTVATFLKVNHLPLGEFRKVFVGGNFASGEKEMLPIVVVQYGGPDVTGSVVLDEIKFWRNE